MDRIASTRDVVAFVTTVDAGSFAAGATRLRLSRSAVAKAVGRLEQRLGTRLLTRTTRRFAVTEDGRRFHARCSAVLDELSRAEAEVAQNGEAPHGVLRMTAPDAFGRRCLLPVIARFLERYPNVQVELRLSDRLSGVIEEGLDLAVRLGHPETLPPDLITRVLGRTRLGFYAAPSYLARWGEPSALDDLGRHDAIAYDRRDRDRHLRVLEPDGTWVTIACSSRFSVDSGEGMLAAAVNGLGIGYMPEFLAADAVRDGALLPLLRDLPGASLPIVAIHPTRRNVPGKTRAFLNMLSF